MKNLSLKLYLISFCLFFGINTFASAPAANFTVRDSIALTAALKQVSGYYKINFLYEELNINSKKVAFNAEVLKVKNIQQVLTELLSPVGLKWSKIDAKNYSIFPDDRKAQLERTGTGTIVENQPGLIQNLADTLESAKLNLHYSAIQNEPHNLNEVYIKANRAVIETKSDRLIYNVENSAMAVGNSLQLLKSAPFVKISGDHTVSLQGKKTMILIDNKPVSESSLENVLQTLPAGNISKMELITHPSAKYDAAYGAVINIITKKSKIEGLTGNVAVSGSVGQYVMSNTNAGLTYKHKGLTLYGTGGLVKGDDVFEVKSERTFKNGEGADVLGNNWKRLSHDDMYSFQVGGDQEITQNQTLGFVVNGGLYHFKAPWTTNNTFRKQGGAIDSVVNTNSTFQQPVYTFNYNLNYHLLTDSGKNELTVLSTFTPWKRNLHQSFPSVVYDASGNVLRTPAVFQTTNMANIKVYTSQVDYAHLFNHQWKLESGIKYQTTSAKNTIDYEVVSGDHLVNVPEFSSNNDLRESISGGYGILSKDWKADKLQIGMRVEETSVRFVGTFKQNYFNTFPTLFYQHNINENNNVSFSYKRTITRTPYYELVPYSVFSNPYTVEQGNPALKPEYDHIFSVGANIHKLTISLNYTSSKGVFGLFPVKQDSDTKLTYFSWLNLNKSYDYSMFLYYPLRFTSWWETQNSGNVLGYYKAHGIVPASPYTISAFHSDFKSAQIFQLAKSFKLEVDAYYWTKYAQDLSRYSGYKNIDAAFLIDVLGGKGQIRLAGEEIIFKRNDYSFEQNFETYNQRDIINTDRRRISVGFTYKFGKTTIKSPDKKLGNEDAMKRLH